MPIDPIAPGVAAPEAKPPAKKLPVKTLNDASFGALVNQDLRTGLKAGPKLKPEAGDGFKSLEEPQRFIPLNRALGNVSPPLSASSVEALGATTKHPLGTQKR